MKLFWLFVGLYVVVLMASCKKDSANSNANYSMVPDTGWYYAQTGTITVVAPEGTYTLGSKDNLSIYHRKDNKNPEIWVIGSFGVNGGAFEMDAPGALATGSATLKYGTFSFPPPQTSNYFYMAYSGTNAGSVTINSYNTNGIAVSGTFTLNVGKYSASTYTGYNRVDNINYTITGTFDLKLNPK